ncbi:MAG: hypothetical protein LIO79_00895 [Rikenellaceae bacterium]|nr:hypothetical protein [Rikenellaceae bacterium]
MKKLFTILALAGVLFSCTKDFSESVADISESSARAGFRLVDGTVEIVNSLGSATRFNMEIGSVNFIGTDGVASSIVENFTNTDFTVSSNVSESYSQQYIGPAYILTLGSDLLEKIDVDINYIFTGTSTNIDNDVLFIIRAEVEGNITPGVLGTATVETSPELGEITTISVDLAGVAQQDQYIVNLYVEAVYEEVPQELVFTLDYTITNNPYTDFNRYAASFVSVRFIGSENTAGYSQNVNFETPQLRTGEAFTRRVYESVSIDYVDSPDKLQYYFYTGEIDNHSFRFVVTTTVTDKDGNVLGTNTEELIDELVDPLTVELTETTGIYEYFIDVDIEVIVPIVNFATVDLDVTVTNLSESIFGDDYVFELSEMHFYSGTPIGYSFIFLTYIPPYYGYRWGTVGPNQTSSVSVLEDYSLCLPFEQLSAITLKDGRLFTYYSETLNSGTVTVIGENNEVLGSQEWKGNGADYTLDVSNYPLQNYYRIHFEFEIE